jgi:arylsulfatase A-like enzyme
MDVAAFAAAATITAVLAPAAGRRAPRPEQPGFVLAAIAIVALAAQETLPAAAVHRAGRAGVVVAATVAVALALRLIGRRGRALPAALLVWPLMMAAFLAAAPVIGRPATAWSLAFPFAALALFTPCARVLAGEAWPRPWRAALGLGLPAAACLAFTALPAGGTYRDLAQPAPWPRGKPSVVLIVLDTVRARNVSAYGYARATTPHLDALAAEGVRYPAAATPGTWTPPAHASLFTGLFPWQHGAGLPDAAAALGDGITTLAEVLSARGYATAAVVANPTLGAASQQGQGFRHYDVRASRRVLPSFLPLPYRVWRFLARGSVVPDLMEWTPMPWRSAEVITDSAARWLRQRPASQPYLLFVNYMDAHTPFTRPPGFADRWPGRVRGWPWRGLPGTMETSRVVALDAVEQGHMMALYDGSLSSLDHHLGRLLDLLRALPGYDDTWVVVTADHGEMLGEHGRLGHDCQLYEEVLRVPLVIRAPRGVRLPAPDPEHPLELVDVAPLLLDALGLPPLPATSAVGTRPETLAMGTCACARRHPAMHAEQVAALVEGHLKYLEEDGRGRLFDLSADPGEALDLGPRRPDDMARLRARLQSWRATLVRVAPPAVAEEGEKNEALRALGYQ